MTDYRQLVEEDNPYLDIVRNEQKQTLRNSMYGAAQSDPNTEAELRKLAERANVPVETVRADRKEIERQTAIAGVDYDNLVKSSPVTANFLGAQADVARDDVGVLERTERAFTAFGQGIRQGSIQDQVSPYNWKALTGTITQNEAAERKRLLSDLNALGQTPERQDSPFSWFLGQTGYTGRQLVSSVREGGKGAIVGGAGAASLAAVAGTALAPVLPEEAVTVPGAFVFGARAGYITASTLYNYKEEAGFAFAEYENIRDVNGQPLDPATARGAAAAAGLLNAGLETVGDIALTKMIPGLDRVLGLGSRDAIRQLLARPTFRNAIAQAGKKWLTAASVEGVTEALQELGVILGRELAQDASGQEFAADAAGTDVERILESGAAGFAGGAGVGLPGAAISATSNIREVRKANQTQQFMEALGETAGESKLRERLPQVFQDFVAQAREQGPVENVYIPVEQFQQYWQSQNADPAAVASEVGVTNYDEAVATGTDVVIPIEQYATNIAPTEHHGPLTRDVRLFQGDLTLREVEALESRRQEVEAEIQKMMEAEGVEAETPAIEQIKQDVLGQLLGRFDRQTADSYATLYSRAINSLSQRAGIDPMELHQQYGLQVVIPLPDILQAKAGVDTVLDPLIDRLRAGEIPTAREIYGKSLTQFLRERGGLQDQGGELSARDAKLWDRDNRRPGEKALVSNKGMTFDQAREIALEAGFDVGDTEVTFLNALDREFRGEPVFMPGQERGTLADLADALTQLDEFLGQQGIDIQTTDNAAIKALIKKASEGMQTETQFAFDQMFFQGGPQDLIGENEGRVLKREPGNFNDAEQKAFDDFLASRDDADRIKNNLETHKGTPYAFQAVEGIFVRQAMRLMLQGKTPDFESSMNSNNVRKVRETLMDKGEQGLWQLLEINGGLMGAAAKPVNNINSSFINCDPSKDCALYCYATKNNYRYANVIVKSELVTLAVELDPVRAAKRVAAEYKATAEFANNKALRLFDKGDGDAKWLPFIKELNKQGIRVQIFSKVPEFLRAVPDMNLKLLSIDNSNMDMADQNQDLPVAFVYTGKDQIDFLAKLAARNQIQVVLPVKLGAKLLDDSQIKELKTAIPKVKPFLCPIDSGFKKLGKTSQKGTWNCTKCDVNGGVGCFHGQATKAVMESLEVKPSTPQQRAQRILELRRQINEITSGTVGDLAGAGRVPPGGVEGLLSEVDSLLGELLRDYDKGGAEGEAVTVGSGTVEADNGPTPAVPRRAGELKGIPVVLGQPVVAGADEGDRRGYIQFGADRRVRIGLLEKADLSTFIHETGHFYLEVLMDLAERADASPQIKADAETLMKWFGVKSRAEIGVKQHEQFARANEAYLMEGKAPSSALRSIFQRVRAWMTLVYRTLTNLNVRMNDDVRGVFDRIYATDQEIEAAQAELDVQALFATADDAGMTQAEFDAYIKATGNATANAKETVQNQLMREYQREREKWWKAKRKEMLAAVTEEIDNTPIYRAAAILSEGKLPDGTQLQLSRQGLERRFGAEFVKRLPRSIRGKLLKENGTDIDTAAEILGFDNGSDLMTGLVNLRPRKDLIEAEVASRMAAEYGDMMLDGTIADEAMAAIHNTQRAKVLEAELLAIRRLQRQVQMVTGAARREEQAAARAGRQMVAEAIADPAMFRSVAQGRIGQMQARDIRPQQYLLAERRASKAAFEAIQRKDYVKAAIEKQRELLNHYMYLEARKAQQQLDTIYNYANKFDKKSTRERLAKAGGGYLEQIDAILEKYEFRRVPLTTLARRQSLVDFAEQQAQLGLIVNVPDQLLDEARLVNYKNATVDELRAVYDTVRNIEHIARLKDKLLRKAAQAEFDAAKKELIDSAMASDRLKSTGELGIPNTVGQPLKARGAKAWKNFDAALIKIEQVIEWLDGGKINGPWARFVFDLANDAQVKEYELHADVTKRIQDLTESMPKGWGDTLTDTFDVTLPGVEGPITRYTLISIALNVGNDSNYQRLTDGYGWSDATVNAALQNLAKEDWDYVQGIWDAVNSLWPEIEALEKRTSGVAPPKVPARTVVTAFGDYAGGYFPLAYDPKLSAVGDKQVEAVESVSQFMSNAYGRARTDRGYTKQRVEKLKAAVRLDYEQVLTSHLAKVIKDVSHREAIYSLNKILKDEEIKEVMIDRLGEAQYREFNKWMQTLVADRADTLHSGNVFAKAIMRFRTNMAIVTMGWKVTTMMAQFAGLGPALDVVKPRFFTQALIDYNRFGPWSTHRETLEQFVYERSGEMKFRSDNIDRDVRDNLRQLRGDNSPLATIRKTAFYLTAMADRQITIPTWLGAYRQALAEGLTEEDAIRAGDRAVRLSQGAAGTKDMAAVQRDNELMKLLTMYYTPFSVLYARMRDVAATTRRVKDMPRLVARSLALVILPAVMGEILAGRGPEEDEDDIWWAIRKMLLYPLASIPILKEGSGVVEASMINLTGEGAMAYEPNWRLSPVAGSIEQVGRTFMKTSDVMAGNREFNDVAWDLLNASGYIFGLPTRQVQISGEYIQDVLNDEANPESPQQAMKELLYGRPKEE